MNREFLIVVVLIIFLSIPTGVTTATAESADSEEPAISVSYDSVIDAKTEIIQTEVTIKRTMTSEQSDWPLIWTLPKNSTLTRVESTQGELQYTRDGTRIVVEENRGYPRESETFTIIYQRPLETQSTTYTKTMDVGLIAYYNEPVHANVTVQNGDLLNSLAYSNNTTTVDKDTVKYSGTGPVNLRVNIAKPSSSPQMQTEQYTVYANSPAKYNETKLRDAYTHATQATGLNSDYETIPIIVQNDSSYEFPLSSSGYFLDGIIHIREKHNTSPIIAHETVHAINIQQIGILPDWFREGVAQLAQTSLDNDKQQFYEYERLEQYNNNNKTWVYTTDWNTSNSFAYEYSELTVKNYVKNNDINELHDVHSTLKELNQRTVNTTTISSNTDFTAQNVCTAADDIETCVEPIMQVSLPEQSEDNSNEQTTKLSEEVKQKLRCILSEPTPTYIIDAYNPLVCS